MHDLGAHSGGCRRDYLPRDGEASCTLCANIWELRDYYNQELVDFWYTRDGLKASAANWYRCSETSLGLLRFASIGAWGRVEGQWYGCPCIWDRIHLRVLTTSLVGSHNWFVNWWCSSYGSSSFSNRFGRSGGRESAIGETFRSVERIGSSNYYHSKTWALWLAPMVLHCNTLALFKCALFQWQSL